MNRCSACVYIRRFHYPVCFRVQGCREDWCCEYGASGLHVGLFYPPCHFFFDTMYITYVLLVTVCSTRGYLLENEPAICMHTTHGRPFYLYVVASRSRAPVNPCRCCLLIILSITRQSSAARKLRCTCRSPVRTTVLSSVKRTDYCCCLLWLHSLCASALY